MTCVDTSIDSHLRETHLPLILSRKTEIRIAYANTARAESEIGKMCESRLGARRHCCSSTATDRRRVAAGPNWAVITSSRAHTSPRWVGNGPPTRPTAEAHCETRDRADVHDRGRTGVSSRRVGSDYLLGKIAFEVFVYEKCLNQLKSILIIVMQ